MTAVNTTSYPSRVAGLVSGLVHDNSSLFGAQGDIKNLGGQNNKGISAVAIATSTTPVLTGAQFVQGLWDVSGAPGGAFTLTTPTAAQIIAALPTTIPQDGSFNFDVLCMNDGTGQTGTVTAGSGVTVLGTATVANNTTRMYAVNVNVLAGTVTMLNLGSMSL